MLPADIYPLIICNLHDRETWISARYVDKLWYAIIMQIEKEPVYDQLVQFNNHGLYCETDYTTIPRLKNKMIHGIVTHVIYSKAGYKLSHIIFEKYIHNIKYIELRRIYNWEDRSVVYPMDNYNVHILYAYSAIYAIIAKLSSNCRLVFNILHNIIYSMDVILDNKCIIHLPMKV